MPLQEMHFSNAELNMLHAQLLGKDYARVTVRQEAGVTSWVIYDKSGHAIDEGAFS